jgi:SAM-dependent methyltransferase
LDVGEKAEKHTFAPCISSFRNDRRLMAAKSLRKNRHAYDLLAAYYDQLFTSHPASYRRARRELGILRGVKSACDLACGTGTTAVDMARRGIKVYAVDLSSAMCRVTREKADKAGVRVTVLRGDMRSFRLPETVDLVACEFDAINHVPHQRDLAAVVKAVARVLRPGGWFYFDANTRFHLEKNWPGTWWMEKPGAIMAMRGTYDRRRAKACLNVEWLIREGNCWRRFHEYVEEVWWTPRGIRQALRGAGFVKISSVDATKFMTGQSFLRPGCRTFYLAQKSEASLWPKA